MIQILHRQQLAVMPHSTRTTGNGLLAKFTGRGPEVVAAKERPAAGARVVQLGERMRLAAACTLNVRKIGSWFAHVKIALGGCNCLTENP